jgi:hypothetical protein
MIPKKDEILAFAKPFLAIVAGALATWLLTSVHVFSIFHFSHDQVAKIIAEAFTFGISALLTWLSVHGVLTRRAAARALAAAPSATVVVNH